MYKDPHFFNEDHNPMCKYHVIAEDTGNLCHVDMILAATNLNVDVVFTYPPLFNSLISCNLPRYKLCLFEQSKHIACNVIKCKKPLLHITKGYFLLHMSMPYMHKKGDT